MNFENVVSNILPIFEDQNISFSHMGAGNTNSSELFDAVLVKKLAATNTITHSTTANQTHIALTGREMDIFPYLNNYSYLDSNESEREFKRKYILRLPVILFSNNLKYLSGDEIFTENVVINSYTTTARSRRSDSQQQEISYVREDDEEFINFRKKLFSQDYLVILKYSAQAKYIFIGVKSSDAHNYQLQSQVGLHTNFNAVPTHINSLFETKEIENENTKVNEILRLLDRNPNLILYGPPGTGKTYYINQLRKNFDYSEFLTFHQSYSYEQFVEGITADIDESGKLQYIVEEGIFRRIAGIAEDNPDKKIGLFVDEINRGNISKIFGELITLIEKTKRKGESEEVEVTLPYSKKLFSVPKNLFLIGTMNTADRSIALIDLALRRRFSFFEITPDFSYFEDANEKIKSTIKAIKRINGIITETIDQEHRIGNSYFFPLLKEEDSNLDTGISYIWLYQILPLLQEYFYTDPKVISPLLKQMTNSEPQRFSFGINYSISNEELLEVIDGIANGK